MKRARSIYIPLLFICVAALLAWTPVRSAPTIRHDPLPLLQSSLPTDGWAVCLVGGMETIPGVPGDRQVFEICHAEGWTLKVYCLEPGIPPPSQGSLCSAVGGDTYWCGDNVQQLHLFAILQTPAPTETPTPTSTNTATVTSSPTLTTTAQTATPALTRTLAVTPTPLPTATPYYRPRPGGPGNAGILPAGLVGLALLGAGIAALRQRALLQQRTLTQPRRRSPGR